MRRGEELDLAAVDAWLRQSLGDLGGAPVVTQYSGGASNWTYRLRYPRRDLVLRRPPAGTKARSAHDMGREFRVQQALAPHFPLVPRVLVLCEDEAVIGAPFYVMERLDGLVPGRDFPAGTRLDPSTARRLSLAFVDTLAALHRIEPATVGLEGLGKGAGYARRQIAGWDERYEKARTWNVPSFRRVRTWLAAHVPEDVAACVIHNDFRLDNLVLDRTDPARILGVLDWEMATVGDPLMDLGNTLAYWVEAGDSFLWRPLRRQPSHLPGMLTRAELVARYFERSGLAPRDLTFYEVYGLFRLAGIAQQIYYRYHHRQTRNPAFRHFWLLVHVLEQRCSARIRRGDRGTRERPR